MTTPAILWAHNHVSEREVAHRWPDGQYDDFRWEDCTFDAGLEFARLCFNAHISATHVETEHLRDDAGEDPLGGTGNDDLLRGFMRRYNYKPRWGTGASTLWNALTPGTAAVIQVRMGVFPYGHRLRRHQPSFTGAHQVLVVRINNWDRAWWCDPLAPDGTGYLGEYVAKSDIQKAMNGLPFPPSFLYDNVIPKPVTPPAPLPPLSGRRIHVMPGSWWDYDVSGTKATGYTIRRDKRNTDGFTAGAAGSVILTTWGGAKRRFVKLTTGAYSGRWVDINDTGSVVELLP